MNHLTEKDYISFVSAAAYNESFVTLAKRIAEHIRQCDDCREQLEAYQTISDALTGYSDEYPDLTMELSEEEPEPELEHQVQYINGQIVLTGEL